MTDFGDFTPEDAWDTDQYDADALARKFWAYRRDRLGHPSRPFDGLTDIERRAVAAGIVRAMAALLVEVDDDLVAKAFWDGYRSVLKAAPTYPELSEQERDLLVGTVIALNGWRIRENLDG